MGRRDLWAWVWPGCVQHSGSCGLQYGRHGGKFSRFSCFTSTIVQILTPEELRVRGQVLRLLALLVQKYKYWHLKSCVPKGSGTQFTCFASTQVQVLTPEELRGRTNHWISSIYPTSSPLPLPLPTSTTSRSIYALCLMFSIPYVLCLSMLYALCLFRCRYRLRRPAGLYMPYALCFSIPYVLCLSMPYALCLLRCRYRLRRPAGLYVSSFCCILLYMCADTAACAYICVLILLHVRGVA